MNKIYYSIKLQGLQATLTLKIFKNRLSFVKIFHLYNSTEHALVLKILQSKKFQILNLKHSNERIQKIAQYCFDSELIQPI